MGPVFYRAHFLICSIPCKARRLKNAGESRFPQRACGLVGSKRGQTRAGKMRCKKERRKALGRMEAERPHKGQESKGKRAVKGMLAKRKERKRGWDPGTVRPRTMAGK